MAVTLEDLAQNSNDKLAQGFINEMITDSYLLGAMTFDDCMTPSGTSDMVYAYRRVTTNATATFRALNAEPTISDAKTTRKTSNVGILTSSWQMDRVARDAAPDLLELKMEEAKNAIIRKFNAQCMEGVADTSTGAWVGLSTELRGGATEVTSATALTSITQAAALAYSQELDAMLSGLIRTPDVLLVSPAQQVKLSAIARVLGIGANTIEYMGKQLTAWNNIPIQVLRDGAISNGDVYALCLGLDEFHGVTLKGGNAIEVHEPDWAMPGAVKTGDAEFVCGIALKNSKAAGVLREKSA